MILNPLLHSRRFKIPPRAEMVIPTGFEPVASSSASLRSIQLSYGITLQTTRPRHYTVEMIKIKQGGYNKISLNKSYL